MGENFFAERVAETYDADCADMFEPEHVEPAVEFLAQHAGSGRILELGIGTGRVALPLSRRGMDVHGIDLSQAMVDRLRAKSGATRIGVSIGDFATAKVEGTFALAYLVFNTIMNLTTQDAQAACFCNVADHLELGGSFVVEVSVPELQRLPVGETMRPFPLAPSHVGYDEIDVVTQSLISHHYVVRDGALDAFSVPFRYVWPSELDLMARFAGLTLAERWANWNREPFTAESRKHVSVWQKRD
jgi:SAM-dependent methyltransferase